jgi:hypothetical protein
MRNANHQPQSLGDQAAALAGVGDRDAHIISDATGSTGVAGESLNMAMGVRVEGIGIVGVEDGMDDFAMSAPPGAPGMIVLDKASVGIVDESREGTTLRNFLGEEDGRMGPGLLDSNSTLCGGFTQYGTDVWVVCRGIWLMETGSRAACGVIFSGQGCGKAQYHSTLKFEMLLASYLLVKFR